MLTKDVIQLPAHVGGIIDRPADRQSGADYFANEIFLMSADISSGWPVARLNRLWRRQAEAAHERLASAEPRPLISISTKRSSIHHLAVFRPTLAHHYRPTFRPPASFRLIFAVIITLFFNHRTFAGVHLTWPQQWSHCEYPTEIWENP